MMFWSAITFTCLIVVVHSAPFNGQNHKIGCFHQFRHYENGERIETSEPCLNCTCTDNMLMCYLRVCPYTKPIGEKCVVNRQEGQCCPTMECSPTNSEGNWQWTTTEEPENAGCFIDGVMYAEGTQIPIDKNEPCDRCYCINNSTECVKQNCTLEVKGCTPVYQDGTCCPLKYECNNDEDTTLSLRADSIKFDCTANNGTRYSDGVQVPSDDPCDFCYCMMGEVVCAVQECRKPADSCVPEEKDPDTCCPTKYRCNKNEIPKDATTILPTTDDIFTSSPETTESPKDEQTTDEPEITTDEAEGTTDEPESTTDEPESTTDEPESTTDGPEATTDEPESTTDEAVATTDGPESTTDEAEATTDGPESTTDEAEATTDQAETATDEEKATTDEAEATTDQAETATDKAEATTDEAEATTDEAESTTDEPESTTDEAEATTDQAEDTTDEPERTTDETETATDEPESTTDEPESTTDEPERTTDETETATDEEKATTDEVEATTDQAEATTDEPESTTDEAEATTDEAEATTDQAEATTDQAEATTDEEKATTDEAGGATDEPESTTNEPESTTDEAEATTDEAEATTDEAETVTDETEATTDEAEATTDEAEATTDEAEATTDEAEATTDEAEATTDDAETTDDETTDVPDTTTENTTDTDEELTATDEPTTDITADGDDDDEGLAAKFDDSSVRRTTGLPSLKEESESTTGVVFNATHVVNPGSLVSESLTKEKKQSKSEDESTSTTELPEDEELLNEKESTPSESKIVNELVTPRVTLKDILKGSVIKNENVGDTKVIDEFDEDKLETTQEPTEESIIESTTSEPMANTVPGEGSCLIDNLTFANGADVPASPSQPCLSPCVCRNSIIVCAQVSCPRSPQPSSCEEVREEGACCPTFKCRKEVEASSNQIDDSDRKQTTPEYPKYEQDNELTNELDNGTACIYESKIYRNSHYVPRENPCDFCFCYKGEILCIQQECPPVLKGCEATFYRNYCCPQYTCRAPITEDKNNSTRKTRFVRSAKFQVKPKVDGCLYGNNLYKNNETIKMSEKDGACMTCVCQNGNVICTPKQPCEPSLEAIESLKRSHMVNRPRHFASSYDNFSNLYRRVLNLL